MNPWLIHVVVRYITLTNEAFAVSLVRRRRLPLMEKSGQRTQVCCAAYEPSQACMHAARFPTSRVPFHVLGDPFTATRPELGHYRGSLMQAEPADRRWFLLYRCAVLRAVSGLEYVYRKGDGSASYIHDPCG